jgi:hypothetical protein
MPLKYSARARMLSILSNMSQENISKYTDKEKLSEIVCIKITCFPAGAILSQRRAIEELVAELQITSTRSAPLNESANFSISIANRVTFDR